MIFTRIIEEETFLRVLASISHDQGNRISVQKRLRKRNDDARVNLNVGEILSRLVNSACDDDLFRIQLAAIDSIGERREGDLVLAPKDLGIEIDCQADPVV